ncbi:MAG: triphosphoribosyl-dephospho-CoA synthase [Isosphaeraceae bacterium]
MMDGSLGPGRLAEIACILEATARKPGNVNRLRDFDDVGLVDFLLSAGAIVAPLENARSLPLGRTILLAVEATQKVVASNTNLGMILLLAPLAKVEEGRDLREGVSAVLESATIEDSRDLFRAIRLARPGGLGRASAQDVNDEPTLSLRAIMSLARDRDLVARQLADGYPDVFEVVLPALREALEQGRSLERAIVFSYLTQLARTPDTLIARKRGIEIAREASQKAAEVLSRPDRFDSALEEFDAWLRLDGHARNPGTTADLIAAALFVALRDGTIELPGLAGRFGRFTLP